MAMLSLCGFSDDTLFKSKCELEEKEAYETFQNDNTVNQMNLYTLPGNVSILQGHLIQIDLSTNECLIELLSIALK